MKVKVHDQIGTSDVTREGVGERSPFLDRIPVFLSRDPIFRSSIFVSQDTWLRERRHKFVTMHDGKKIPRIIE